MKLLETVNIDEQEYLIYYSHHTALRDVLSLILRNYAEQLEKKFMFPKTSWSELEDAQIVYVTDKEKQILGGICFYIEEDFNAAVISLVFTNGSNYNEFFHKICFKHLQTISKTAGLTGIVHSVHRDNEIHANFAKHVGLEPSFYWMSRPLVDNDQE